MSNDDPSAEPPIDEPEPSSDAPDFPLIEPDPALMDYVTKGEFLSSPVERREED